jgi:iron complex outermembrane receptor protein
MAPLTERSEHYMKVDIENPVALPVWRRLTGALAKVVVTCLCATALAISASAQDGDDLSTKSLEELMDIKVISASKKEETLFKTAAAIFVITQEDIRRSGMTRIPDLLRMVPGVEVERIDGVGWSVSVRGFDRRYTNKLLVLVDGRSIYSIDISGVHWEALDMPLEIIDRIEVIRGPGGSLWGANAVNGVINIITKHAKETQGGLVTVVGGSEDRTTSAVYGGTLGDAANYRVYGKYLNGSGLVDSSGQNTNDGENSAHGGMRIDWQPSASDSLTFLSEIYDMGARETSTAVESLADPFAGNLNILGRYTGGDVLGRWDHAFSDTSDMSFQFYFDRLSTTNQVEGASTNTFDFDFQHHFAFGNRQDIIWGLGYRLLEDHFTAVPLGPVQFVPAARNSQVFSTFIQDQITLIKDRLRLTLGTKVEHDDYAGFQVEPNIRLLWTPATHQTLWTAVSRAVRTPSRGEESIIYDFEAIPGPDGLPVVVTVFGNPAFKSEDLLAYEAGYRVEPVSKVSIDIATFYNVYQNLQTDVVGTPFFDPSPVPRIVEPITFGNQMSGHTYGVEPSVSWAVTHFWKLTGSYSFLHMALKNNSGNLLGDNAGDSPQHEAQIRSYLNLPGKLELDAAAYHTSALPDQGISQYTRVDARFGWRPAENVELSVGGQNLVSPRHLEINPDDSAVISTLVKRTIYAKVTWRF